MDSRKRLATILSLDVVGYSRAAERDDDAAARAVRSMRAAIDERVAPFNGRVFSTAGDGFMLEFPSAGAGVQAAMALLDATASGDGALPNIRIGLHLGDVIEEADGDLLGHGVNVAARLQALAEPGSALVSETVRAQVRAAANIPFIPQGRVRLDKMDERLEVFLIAPAGAARFSKISRRRLTRLAVAGAAVLAVLALGFGAWRLSGAQAEAPLLAVLPFDAIPRDAPDTAFAEDFSAELHYVISRSGPGLRLIGQTSSFSLTGEAKRWENVHEQLRASHILDGSIERRDGDSLIVTYELIDAASAEQLGVFRIETDVARVEFACADIASRVRDLLELVGDGDFSARRLDAGAVDLYLRGKRFFGGDGEAQVQSQRDAIQALRRATQLEPAFARAWRQLAYVYATYRFHAPSAQERAQAETSGRQAAERYLELAPREADAWVMRLWFEPDPAAAEHQWRRAVEIDPHHWFVVRTQAGHLVGMGRGEDALVLLDPAIELDPLNTELRRFRVDAALTIEPSERAELVLRQERAYGGDGWRAMALAWLARGDVRRARRAARAYREHTQTLRSEIPAEAVGRLMETERDLQQVISAYGGGAQARMQFANRLAERVRSGRAQRLNLRNEAYGFELPAIAALAGPDAAFTAWSDRLDTLSAEDDARLEAGAFHAGALQAPFAALQRDPRFWTMAARFEPHLGGAGWMDDAEVWPPDFCTAPAFPYDCAAAAAAAFNVRR